MPWRCLREAENVGVIQGPLGGLGILGRCQRDEVDKYVLVNVKLMHWAVAVKVRLSYIASCQTHTMFVDRRAALRRHSQPKVATSD